MFPSAAAVSFTVVFAATGLYALVRYVAISSRPGSSPTTAGPARAVELLHLLMSVAMIAMAWGWSGGPESGSGVVQLAVFGTFTLVFATLAARARGFLGVVGPAAHSLMATAMVWMVAAMPVIMGHGATSDAGGDGHGGHAGHGAATTEVSSTPLVAEPTPIWATVLNGVIAALLLAAGLFWALRAVRAVRGDHAEAATGPTGPTGAAHLGGAAADPGGVATLAPETPATSAPPRERLGALAATCHTLMSLGMAAMLLAMA